MLTDAELTSFSLSDQEGLIKLLTGGTDGTGMLHRYYSITRNTFYVLGARFYLYLQIKTV